MSELLDLAAICIDIGLSQGWAVLAIAIALRLYAFPDLTVEGSFVASAAVFGVAFSRGMPMGAAVLLAVLSGALLGAATGFLNARLGVNRFLAGIAMAAIGFALSLRIMGGANLSWLGKFLDQSPQPESLSLIRNVAMAAGGVFVIPRLLQSVPGLASRVSGERPRLAQALGFRPAIYLALALGATNGLAGLSGALVASQQGFVDVGMGAGLLLNALAAMSLGEVATPRRLPLGVFVVVSSFLGSILFQGLLVGSTRVGMPANDFRLVVAILTLVIVIPRTSRQLSQLVPEGTG